jgi:7-cyano-7-deazaguanine synthase
MPSAAEARQDWEFRALLNRVNIRSMPFNLVLLSGGIDSATALTVASAGNDETGGLYIDYGQAAAVQERQASVSVARHIGVAYASLTVEGAGQFGVGEIRGRNAFLLHAALLFMRDLSGTVSIAVHAGTGYRDCGPDFVDLMQRSFDFQTGGQVQLATPFLSFTKPEVLRLARSLDVPIDLTYSCEAGKTPPCNQCHSCLDRELIYASA